MRPLSFLLAFLIGGICSAQEQAISNRGALKLRLFVDDENFYEDDVKAGPYFVKEGVIQVYPGERLYVDAKVGEGGVLTDMHVVTTPKDTAKVIILEFVQHANGRQHEMMMLTVNNPYDDDLHYSAIAYFLKHGQWGETTTIPVGARISAFESWPDVIVTMALSDWKVGPSKR